MDPYCANGVRCDGQILICKVTVNLHYVIMKLITRSYNSKFIYKNFLTIKIYVPQYMDYRS
jgi:hypothetical protein